MLKKLKNFFDSETNTDNKSNENLELLCGLMIEAANTDGIIEQSEIDKIYSILVDVFKENHDEARIYIKKAIDNGDNSKSLFYYTSKLNKEFPESKKLLLIETLWEVVLSDGKIHEYESSLIRRLSGLLYISDVNSGNARQRALNKLKNN